MQRYLITGGSGLIGRALIKRLQLSEADITVLTREPERTRKKLGGKVSLISGLAEIQQAEPFDFVINLAGEPIADKAWTEKRKQLLWDSRVSLTQELITRIREMARPPKVFISGSAVGWYGDCGNETVTESHTANQEYTHHLCDAWEKAALAMPADETRVVVLRTGLVLSPDGGFLSRMWLPFKLGLGARLGDGAQYMPWIHIDDMVAAIIFLLNDGQAAGQNSELNGPFNLTAPNPVNNRTFTSSLGECLSRPAFFVAPKWGLKLAMGELSRLLLTGQKAVPEKLLAAGFKFRFDELKKALADVRDNKANQ